MLARNRGLELAIEAVVGEKLFALPELDKVEQDAGQEFSDLLGGRTSAFTFNITADRTLELADLDLARRAADPDIVDFTGIGPGRPLALILETIYIGDYPDTLKWIPGRQHGDVLVTSSHKPFQEVPAAARAVHMLQASAERNSYLEFKAHAEGTRLVYYSPAVTDISIQFTFELSVDREFDAKLGKSLRQALIGAAALPVLAPAAPYLVVASGAVPIAQEAADMLARPRTFYEEGVEINMSRAGLARSQASGFVLYPDGDESPFAGKYRVKPGDWVLRDAEGKPYAGPLPYVVVSADGADRPELKRWSGQVASAALLERFFTPDSFLSASLALATKGMSLYNDAVFRDKAADALEAAKGLDGPAKEAKMHQYEAYLKNIQDDDIRDSAKKK